MRSLLFILLSFSFVAGHAQPGFRLLSYNVRNCKGMDNQVEYDRVAAVINTAKPDIVALQELDSATQRSKGIDVLQALAERCGMTGTFSAAISYSGGKYGVGILSKEKPLQVTRIALPGREEARTLLIAEFAGYIVACTHFSLTAADQLESAAIINRQLAGFSKPVYLAGDFNATPDAEPIRSLSSNWKLLSGTTHTFPSNLPDRCIDYIFSRNSSAQVLSAKVIEEPMASDHRPVLVEVRSW